MRRLNVRAETWPLRSAFTISRGSRTEITVVVAEIADGELVGRGECFPHSRYGESPETVTDAIRSVEQSISQGLDRAGLLQALPQVPRATRSTVHCGTSPSNSRARTNRNFGSGILRASRHSLNSRPL